MRQEFCCLRFALEKNASLASYLSVVALRLHWIALLPKGKENNMTASHIGLLFFFLYSRIHVIISLTITNHADIDALRTLKSSWGNAPASWNQSNDPCGLLLPWEGVICTDSRVTALRLSAAGLKGKLGAAIADLTQLNSLILDGNSFTGSIPDELGNLSHLSFLNLAMNELTGNIPPSLGKLSKLSWIDLADNQLSGPLPVSTGKTPGLDLLVNANTFYFQNNKLSGSIPSKLFSSNMVLQTLFLYGNQLNGKIPDSLGFVQTLQHVCMDQNALSGGIPSTIINHKNLTILSLAHNQLSHALPDLSKMTSLCVLDLSNNSFDAAEAPTWFSTLPSLISLSMAYGSLQGPVPTKLFSLPMIQTVQLRNNAFKGSLSIGGASMSSQLGFVDLQNNHISSATLGVSNSTTLMLMGNPICAKALSNTTSYCHQKPSTRLYSKSGTI